MNEFIRDSPALGHRWCPGCEPDRDPTREILLTTWCDTHRVKDDGLDDALVGAPRTLPVGEVDGTDCRLMAELLARPR